MILCNSEEIALEERRRAQAKRPAVVIVKHVNVPSSQATKVNSKNGGEAGEKGGVEGGGDNKAYVQETTGVSVSDVEI